jgi:hypothetical protein
VKPVEQSILDRLLTDLDSSDKVAVRKKAMEELEKLGELAVPALEKVLASDPALETRKRVEEVLGKVLGTALTGERLRLVRAVEVLEGLGSAEAKQVLQTLAGGAPGALPTREAQAALARLSRP